MKKLLVFLSGFVTGVIAVNLYELFGVPAMPSPDMDETQPIYIGEPENEVTGYELYVWSGESE